MKKKGRSYRNGHFLTLKDVAKLSKNAFLDMIKTSSTSFPIDEQSNDVKSSETAKKASWLSDSHTLDDAIDDFETAQDGLQDVGVAFLSYLTSIKGI